MECEDHIEMKNIESRFCRVQNRAGLDAMTLIIRRYEELNELRPKFSYFQTIDPSAHRLAEWAFPSLAAVQASRLWHWLDGSLGCLAVVAAQVSDLLIVGSEWGASNIANLDLGNWSGS